MPDSRSMNSQAKGSVLYNPQAAFEPVPALHVRHAWSRTSAPTRTAGPSADGRTNPVLAWSANETLDGFTHLLIESPVHVGTG